MDSRLYLPWIIGWPLIVISMCCAVAVSHQLVAAHFWHEEWRQYLFVFVWSMTLAFLFWSQIPPSLRWLWWTLRLALEPVPPIIRIGPLVLVFFSGWGLVTSLPAM